jgi:hypothetical protein
MKKMFPIHPFTTHYSSFMVHWWVSVHQGPLSAQRRKGHVGWLHLLLLLMIKKLCHQQQQHYPTPFLQLANEPN